MPTPLPRLARARHRAPSFPRHRCLGGQCVGERCAVHVAAVLRPGRRGGAHRQAEGQPEREEPGRHLGPSAGAGHTRDVYKLEREVEVLEIDGLPRSGVIGASLTPASSTGCWLLGYSESLVLHLPAPPPGRVRDERNARARSDARLPLVGLTPGPGAPRGQAPKARLPKAEENQAYCSKPVRWSQATPTENREVGPAHPLGTR